MQKTKPTKPQTPASVLAAIKANDSVFLERLYVENYPKIEALVIKNSGTRDHAKDIYQEAFLALWKNVKQGSFATDKQDSVRAYLYTIAKNKWMDYLRSADYKKSMVSDQLDKGAFTKEGAKEVPSDTNQERLQQTMQAFSSLGEPCKSILSKFYFEKTSIAAIASEFNLDPASAKNKKYRCMQKLRTIALNK